MAKFQTSHKVTTKSGIEQEESLLYETAALESSLNTTIIELENDTKLVLMKKNYFFFICVILMQFNV